MDKIFILSVLLTPLHHAYGRNIHFVYSGKEAGILF